MIELTLTAQELILIKAALAHYRLAGFPMGRSTGRPIISMRDRLEWANFGMELQKKIQELK